MLLAYSTTSDFEVMISELAKCSLEDLIKANLISNKKIPKATQIVYARQLAQGKVFRILLIYIYIPKYILDLCC